MYLFRSDEGKNLGQIHTVAGCCGWKTACKVYVFPHPKPKQAALLQTRGGATHS